MKYKTTTIASVLGITAAGFISVWVCDRFVKRRKQTKKMSIVFNDVVNDTETAILFGYFSKTYENQDYVRYDQEMEYDGEKGNVP